MRHVLVAALLFPAAVTAAPVKVDPKAERAKLEALWKDLQSFDTVVRAGAVLGLVEHPRAVSFLKEKLTPVAATKEETTARLKDLNSDDEKVRERAYDELRYFDPRLALTVAEQVEAATTEFARRRLLRLWQPRLWPSPDADRIPVNATLSLRMVKEGEVEVKYRQKSAVGVETTTWNEQVQPVARYPSHSWITAALAALALDRIGTPAATALLERLATGHPDAFPTKFSVALLQPGPSEPFSAKRFDRIWRQFWDGEPIATARGLFALIENPETAALLKPKMLPIRADKKQITMWLKALNSDDEKVWKPAYHSLMYHQPLLAVSVEDQIEAVTNDAGRSRLMAVYSPDSPNGTVRVRQDFNLTIDGERLLGVVHRGGSEAREYVTIQPLAEYTPAPWRQVRLAVLALERAKSPEAVAVLKQLADGHPAIRPTRDAKAALERLGK
ncbi:MAG: hypothetical protein ABGY75_14090 [Gemmataceae bacterium]